jgi:hypothetical protein
MCTTATVVQGDARRTALGWGGLELPEDDTSVQSTVCARSEKAQARSHSPCPTIHKEQQIPGPEGCGSEECPALSGWRVGSWSPIHLNQLHNSIID